MNEESRVRNRSFHNRPGSETNRVLWVERQHFFDRETNEQSKSEHRLAPLSENRHATLFVRSRLKARRAEAFTLHTDSRNTNETYTPADNPTKLALTSGCWTGAFVSTAAQRRRASSESNVTVPSQKSSRVVGGSAGRASARAGFARQAR